MGDFSKFTSDDWRQFEREGAHIIRGHELVKLGVLPLTAKSRPHIGSLKASSYSVPLGCGNLLSHF